MGLLLPIQTINSSPFALTTDECTLRVFAAMLGLVLIEFSAYLIWRELKKNKKAKT